jgi:hypothetical protein
VGRKAASKRKALQNLRMIPLKNEILAMLTFMMEGEQIKVKMQG